LFDPSTIANMAAHFRQLLSAVVAAPNTALSALSMLSDDERQHLLHDANRTDHAVPAPTLLDLIRDRTTAIFNREGDAIAPLVAASCRIKAEVVSADERESGLRRILNFGHTIGHALEAATKYKQFRHGEAIGYGMLAALNIGVARGITPKALLDEIEALIAQLGPLPTVSDISSKEVLAAIGRDKKVVAGTLHFVAATDRGKTTELTDVT
jgi:3-dehydroquinate synthase